jgi:hypothetical protein
MDNLNTKQLITQLEGAENRVTATLNAYNKVFNEIEKEIRAKYGNDNKDILSALQQFKLSFSTVAPPQSHFLKDSCSPVGFSSITYLLRVVIPVFF